MKQDEQYFSQKSMPQRRNSGSRRRTNHPPAQNMDDSNAQTVNFLAQSTFLKLRKLANFPESPQNSNDQEIEFLLNKIQQLEAKVQVLEKKIKYKKKKRIRRTSEQILKKIHCKFCNKKYGSLVSLNLHLKNKHSPSVETEKEGPKTEQKFEE